MRKPTKIGCPICKYYQFDGTCTAFPEGIPFGFVAGLDAHTEPTSEQQNDIVFEWISPQEQKLRFEEARTKYYDQLGIVPDVLVNE
jgi:hypothetical protein